jgi:DNA-binding transcriptional LysR family regulator
MCIDLSPQGETLVEIRDLTYMVAVATAGKFSRAARSLGLDTSTISRRIGQLENELGLTLFERGRSGVRLTAGGRAVMPHIRRALAELDAIKCAGLQSGSGAAGEVRLGVRMPPVGEPLKSLLAHWHDLHPNVALTVSELSDQDIPAALAERRLDVAFLPSHALWPRANAVPLYRERLMAALPLGHRLVARESVDWTALRDETFLVQGWDESQTAREFYASFLGSGVEFHSHAASKQSVLALVGAGFGITLATMSQSQVIVPDVVFKPIDESNAWVQIELVWHPELEDAAVGRFVAYLRDARRSLDLL